MAKIHKFWYIHTDLDIGSAAANPVFVQDDNYAHLLQLSFVRNRRAIQNLYDIEGSIWLHFFMPNDEEAEYELVDIIGDKGQFPLPASILSIVGQGELHVEWRNEMGALLNQPTPLTFTVLVNPWEVN